LFNAAPSGGNPQVLVHLRSDALGLTMSYAQDVVGHAASLAARRR